MLQKELADKSLIPNSHRRLNLKFRPAIQLTPPNKQFAKSVVGQTNISKVQSRALARADTTISGFSTKHQLINFINRRSGGHNTNSTPSASSVRWAKFLTCIVNLLGVLIRQVNKIHYS